jgi:hypothetical protein
MFIVPTRKVKKSPSGATFPVSMPLLTELRILLFENYKHAAPLGLKQIGAICEIRGYRIVSLSKLLHIVQNGFSFSNS